VDVAAMIELPRTSGCSVIVLEVPGIIQCRDMVLRTVSSACRLIFSDADGWASSCSEFTAHMVSAVGEAYNNIVLHGYAGRETGPVTMQIENCPRWMLVTMRDSGASFDPSQASPPDLAALPECGLGVFIMRSFVDELTYTAGPPNVLTLLKRLDGGEVSAINNVALTAGKTG
jgi:serine/threonine-protein kinase RsbW